MANLRGDRPPVEPEEFDNFALEDLLAALSGGGLGNKEGRMSGMVALLKSRKARQRAFDQAHEPEYQEDLSIG